MISNCLVNRLIHYCDEKYRSDNCQYDANRCAELRCLGNCQECLNQIHFPYNYEGKIIKYDYDCKNILYLYVCCYLIKYASEMYYLLKSSKLINEIEFLRILSIGCGDCPDLIAFEEYIKDSNITHIDYKGIDTNELWKDIHNVIQEHYNKSLNKKFNIDYLYDSFFSFDIDGYKPNVIVIQYLFSYLYTHNKQVEVDQIIDKIKDYINNVHSSNTFYVLINDVNSINVNRDILINCLRDKLKNVNIYYFQYNGINERQRVGVCHYSNGFMFKYPDGVQHYGYVGRNECTSIQMLVKINKENYDY